MKNSQETNKIIRELQLKIAEYKGMIAAYEWFITQCLKK